MKSTDIMNHGNDLPYSGIFVRKKIQKFLKIVMVSKNNFPVLLLCSDFALVAVHWISKILFLKCFWMVNFQNFYLPQVSCYNGIFDLEISNKTHNQ